ncbi:Crp/Fnr family transcriptional regulator [Paraburkholderia sp. J12]|uniref:Crp/Fnr family transcriptional regulator n=1 Tax=Paraburkholderia sp. J12 TaxID=2805432 RepID=UPI002ABE6C75|nr:Crp/Fnr family transcriptional regulator [Paraburkholderia sp. J12]
MSATATPPTRTFAAERRAGYAYPSHDALLRRALDPLTRQRVIKAFLKHPCLSNWSADAAATLVDAGYEKTWLHGELVLPYQAECKEIHIVLAGALEAGWVSASGARVIGEYIQPDTVINIIPALDQKGSLCDMYAHGTTQLFHIPRAAMLELFERQPALMRGFFELICSRNRELNDRFRFSRLADFRARVAERLLSLADRYGNPVEAGVEIGLKLSQDDLAALLGVSRQSINKELRAFADCGWIEIRYGQVTILDSAALLMVREASE